MKTISRTISVVVFVNLVMASFALGEKAAEEERTEVIPEPVALPAVEVPVSPKPPVPLRVFSSGRRGRVDQPVELALPTLTSGSRPSGLEAILVIPTAESIEKRPDFVEATAKELNIMCRIFDKELDISGRGLTLTRLRRGGLYEDFFFDPYSGRVRRKTQGIYLDGYGALFLMQVDFPLSGPSQVEEQDKQIGEAVDEIWRKAEQELYEPEELRKKEADLAKEYDAEKVEGLKRDLIRTLKHTTNIQSLKADDSIIITVTGRQSAANSARVLIIRAKKSDVDAFAKGKLDFDKFGEKVQMLTY